jgi:hypothetical protein
LLPLGNSTITYLVPFRPKIVFSHDREYEAYPKAVYLKINLVKERKFRLYFNKEWKAYVTLASELLHRADPEMMLVLFEIILLADIEEERVSTCDWRVRISYYP